jgi:hypothetical protein
VLVILTDDVAGLNVGVVAVTADIAAVIEGITAHHAEIGKHIKQPQINEVVFLLHLFCR